MRAIDVHTHPPTAEYLLGSFGPLREAMVRHFRRDIPVRTLDDMAAEYARLDLGAVVSAWDAETTMGTPATRNDLVAEFVALYPERFVGWASVDPWRGREAVREVRRAVTELGLTGVGEFHPILQEFFPNDRHFYPLWEACLDLGIPVSFHTGTTGVGSGLPGGAGYHLKYTHPLRLDDLAADFPDLTIIACHPSVPWQDEMLAVALHKGNVYLDLSGWSPKYFPPSLVQYARTLLADKCMFGSDYPWITPEHWLAEFDKLEFPSDVRSKVLYENARRILRLPF